MNQTATVRRLPLPPTLLALALLLAAAFTLACAIGEVRLAPTAIWHAVGHKLLPRMVRDADPTTTAILWELRLPRVLLAALVGATLAIAGAVLQGLTQNPLADPYTVGVSSGASVGAGIAVLLGLTGAWHGLAQPTLAFAAGMVTMALVFTLARVGGRLHTAAFLLAGIVVGSFLWSITTLLLALAKTEQRQILAFLMGRFNEAEWTHVALLTPLAFAGVAIFILAGRGLDAFAFGEETARSVGVDTERFKLGLFALAALLTAVSVSVAGIIGFVGLIAPHLARSVVGPPHRGLIPAAALVGATLTILSDLVARTVLPNAELPVGVITALLGAPFFALLLRRQVGQG